MYCMEVYAFGNNGDGQITGPSNNSGQLPTKCLIPTEVHLRTLDRKVPSSALHGYTDTESERFTTSNIESAVDHTATSSLNKSVCTALSWSNLMCFVDGTLYISGWQGTEACKLYTTSLYNIKNISSGWMETFFTTRDGHCYVWERKDWNSVPKEVTRPDDELSSNFSIVHTEEKYTVITTETGDVGLIEKAGKGDYVYRPLVSKLNVKQVSCGKEHVLMLTRIGEVYSYGGGSRGQLGHGSVDAVPEVRVVEALEGVAMIDIASGGWHSAAVSDAGDLYVWGWNESGQLGLPCRQIQDKNETNQLPNSRCSSHENLEFVNILTLPCALDFEDCPECGRKNKLQIGSENAGVDCEVDVTEDEPLSVAKVACGSRHTIVLTDAGQVYTWGWSGQGQLGHGDTISRDKPTNLQTFVDDDSRTPIDVNAGAWNSVIIVSRNNLSV